jgi:hypothetical protein
MIFERPQQSLAFLRVAGETRMVALDDTAGLDLKEDGDDFILVVRSADGTESQVRLTERQMMTLVQSAPVFRDKIVSRRSPGGNDVSAVVVTPVTHVGIQPDSLKELVLLTLQSSTRGRLTFGLPPNISRLIVEHLPGILREIEEDKPTKQ